MTRPTRRLAGALAAMLGVATVGCAGSDLEPPAEYRPATSVLEVVAVLQRHVADDTYRFEAARDFSGRNVYRSTLLRLESIEVSQEEALRAGHLDDVIAFAKGRALERLRAFDLAAMSHRRAAERDGELRAEALRSAALCDALDEAARTGFDAERPDDVPEDPPPAVASAPPRDDAAVLAAWERRVALLEALRADVQGSHYAAIAQEEIERADVARAQWFVATRRLSGEGDARALAELQRVVERHRESKRANRHLLALADLYARFAEEYVAAYPPEGLRFDPATFQEWVDSAARLYEAVGRQDGTPERLEAGQRLEALLSFSLRVDGDRFTP